MCINDCLILPYWKMSVLMLYLLYNIIGGKCFHTRTESEQAKGSYSLSILRKVICVKWYIILFHRMSFGNIEEITCIICGHG